MRQMSSGCLCSSADWTAPELAPAPFRPNGGSNQNQRSVGNGAVILTSAIRKLSSNTRPSKPSPRKPRIGERAPSQATSQSAASR